ncbi:unnamed protein product [Leptosia nina]|uniref:Tudor domain-containing protein 5 n=1 Tax=Leptosia nina TaxID=320188 RepID=A0AAV1JUE1_9NEOP
MEDELKELKSHLRSLVVSSPSQIDAYTLCRDYREMIGERIPIHKYGYRDPVAFLKERCSDSFLFQGPPKNPVLTLIVPDALKYIDKMVQKQKSSPYTKFRGKRRSVLASTSYSSHSDSEKTDKNLPKTDAFPTLKDVTRSNILERDHKTITSSSKYGDKRSTLTNIDIKPTSNYQPNDRSISSSTLEETENMPFAKRNNKVIDSFKNRNEHSERQPCNKRDSPLCGSLMHSYISTYEVENHSQRNSVKTSFTGSSTKRAELAELVEEISSIVLEHSDGMWSTDILKGYRHRTGRDINYHRFGYTSLMSVVQLAERLTAKQMADGAWRVWPADAPEPAAPPLPAPSLRLDDPPPSFDSEEALPGVDYEEGVFPLDCLHYTESIPAARAGDVRPGDMLEVIVGEVYSPSHFWLLRLGPAFNVALGDIMDLMTEYYERGEGRDRWLSQGAVRVGHFCACRYDADWHRSIITKIVDSDTVKVRHVDYGTVESVPTKRLKPLRREWAALPVQAMRARLATAQPPASGFRWPRSSAVAFLRLVSDKRLVADVVNVDEEDDILDVVLVDTSTDEDVYTCEELVRGGFAETRRRLASATSERHLWPTFDALESGETPNFAEIQAYLRNGVILDHIDEYRRHVPPNLPTPRPQTIPVAPNLATPRPQSIPVAPNVATPRNQTIPVAPSLATPRPQSIPVAPNLATPRTQITPVAAPPLPPLVASQPSFDVPFVALERQHPYVLIPVAACQTFEALGSKDVMAAYTYMVAVIRHALPRQDSSFTSPPGFEHLR